MDDLTLTELMQKIESGDARVCVIGLGYVGQPLASALSEHFKVFGYDVNGKAASIPGVERLETVAGCDIYIICVPTPLDANKEPDLGAVRDACGKVVDVLVSGNFVILESTTYPGTTEEVVRPILEKSGLRAGGDFGLAYSPERIDPGNSRYNISNTPKIVGGLTEECTDIAAAFYGKIAEVYRVRDCRAAEAAKMVENVFRNVNIALANELALIFERMDIDTWEVIDAAATKPFGYMPFYPGPGVGGHCIPLDPYYLAYQAKKYGITAQFIRMSGEFNDYMPKHVVELAEMGLASKGKTLRGSKVAIFGLAYKPNISDTRESPAFKIIEELKAEGAEVLVHDPYVDSLEHGGRTYVSHSMEEAAEPSDCIILVTAHKQFSSLKTNPAPLVGKVVVDCKNILQPGEGYTYLGVGKPHDISGVDGR
ncbi:MAG: nucleotide sugar dehydrogenase [Candidatus Thermoplasmatota archaeon]|nr:nucleotide sugar dehydrogenase [Candidatus Thermoplasmatota archaeon]